MNVTSLPGRTLQAVRAIAEAIFATAQPAPENRIDFVCREFEDHLVRAGSRARLVFGISIFAVSVLSPFFLRRWGPLRTLSLPDRIEALTRFEASPLAAPLLAIKAILCLIHYEHPDAAREIGFVGMGSASKVSGRLAS